jgi:hypothetical protein
LVGLGEGTRERPNRQLARKIPGFSEKTHRKRKTDMRTSHEIIAEIKNAFLKMCRLPQDSEKREELQGIVDVLLWVDGAEVKAPSDSIME